MASGAPVVCSNASSLPELAGDAALLIDPDDGDALVIAIRQVIDRHDLAQQLRERGLQQAHRFTWKSCAEQTAQYYAQLLR
jgi:alpha-1,3-rhamnosyl/mannosyltransferase